MNLPRLRKEQPKRILDDYFQRYEKRYREKLTESELARRMTAAGLKIDQSTINRIRHGSYPDIDTALLIATYIEVDFMAFIGLDFWAPPNPDALSKEAREIGQDFDKLHKEDRKSIRRIIKALRGTGLERLTA